MKRLCFLLFIFFVFSININAEKFEVEFNKCVDGDTFKILIDNEVKTVRMLAVDTPETVKPGTDVQPYGKEASEYTCDRLSNANKIELEYDSNSSKADKYGRLLAWVYVDGEMLQKELISLGYAKVAYIYGKYSYLDELYLIEEKTANDKIGIWSEEEYLFPETDEDDIVSSIIDEIKNATKKFLNKIIKSIINNISEFISDLLESIFK